MSEETEEIILRVRDTNDWRSGVRHLDGNHKQVEKGTKFHFVIEGAHRYRFEPDSVENGLRVFVPRGQGLLNAST